MNGVLRAYLERIGYAGSLSRTYETLCALQHAHVLAIPFENLDVLLGRPISLELEALHEKLLVRRRGGYCFEHNTLFLHVLRELGFSVTPLAGRVHVGLERGVIPPRTHMCLRVHLPDGDALADAGFGGAGPRRPLALREGAELRVGSEHHRLVRQSANWMLQSKVDGAFADLCTFGDDPQHAIDYEVANHYTSTHPSSRFRLNLMVMRGTPEGSAVLRNDRLSLRGPLGTSQRIVKSRAELPLLLRDLFDLKVSGVETLRVPALSHWDT